MSTPETKNPYVENWGKQLHESYKKTAEELHSLCRSNAQRFGKNSAFLEFWKDHSNGEFVLRSKMGMWTSFEYGDGVQLGLAVKSCHYGLSSDEVELTLYEQNKEVGEISFTAPCRKLDYGKVADILRRAADAIDSDQYTPGANTDFAQFCTTMENIQEPEKQ